MFSRTLAFSLSLAGFTSASPALVRKAFPPRSTATAFTLVANVTDLSTDFFEPSINGWNLAGVHVGAGQNTLVLDPTYSDILFENGTGVDVSRESTNVVMDQGYYPFGLIVTDLPDSDNVQYFGEQAGSWQTRLGIRPTQRDAYARLFAPTAGTFVVCNETTPVYTRPQYPVRFVEADGEGNTSIPELCVAIELLAQCAELNPLQDGAAYNHDLALPVACYDDVSAIDWSQY
jgi:hypothetical protein